jgi:hypothetical protein
MTMRVRDMADLEREVLEEMKDDYVGLWEIARLVGAELDTEDEPTIRDNTLHVVENMIMHGLIRPGAAKDNGEFEPWAEDPGRAILRIDAEWEDLGRMPGLGEGAWFDLTDYGERVAAT